MGDGDNRLLRRSFVVHADGQENALVVQDLATLRRVRVATLELVSAQLEDWLRAGADHEAAPSTRLTRSEGRVVQLALDGLTNRQIGLALGVRLRTVESHLTSAYRKLGVRSRRELAGQKFVVGPR